MQRHRFGRKQVKLLLLAALVAVAGCSSREEKAARAAASAQALFDMGRYEVARTFALTAVRERDDLAEYWVLLGRTDLALNLYGSAYNDYTRVLELQAANPEALQMVAELGYQLGRSRDAINAADRLLALNPGITRATFIKGMIALQDRRLPDAVGYGEQILRQNPKDEGGVILLARAKAIGGDRAAGIKLINDNMPATGSSYAMLATLLEINRAVGDVAGMTAAFEKLVAQQPENAGLKFDFATMLYKSGDTARARELLTSIARSRPDDALAHRQIVEMWIANDPAPLPANTVKAIARTGPPNLRIATARYKLARGLPNEAAAVLEAIKGREDLSDAQALYATAREAMGYRAQATAIVNDVLKRDENNPDALALRSRIALASRDIRSALNDAQLLVRDHPEDESARVLLANVFVAKGEDWRARQIFEESIRAMPLSTVVARGYVRFLNERGGKERAIGVAGNLVRVAPGSVRAWELLTEVCRHWKNAACQAEGVRGKRNALATFKIDERPGPARYRSLSGQL